jgi:hypothetical protein
MLYTEEDCTVVFVRYKIYSLCLRIISNGTTCKTNPPRVKLRLTVHEGRKCSVPVLLCIEHVCVLFIFHHDCYSINFNSTL